MLTGNFIPPHRCDWHAQPDSSEIEISRVDAELIAFSHFPRVRRCQIGNTNLRPPAAEAPGRPFKVETRVRISLGVRKRSW